MIFLSPLALPFSPLTCLLKSLLLSSFSLLFNGFVLCVGPQSLFINVGTKPRAGSHLQRPLIRMASSSSLNLKCCVYLRTESRFFFNLLFGFEILLRLHLPGFLRLCSPTVLAGSPLLLNTGMNERYVPQGTRGLFLVSLRLERLGREPYTQIQNCM